jgi:DNA-binding NarL/FixJ family response regulator
MSRRTNGSADRNLLPLTPRAVQTLILLRRGHSEKQVAKELGISPNTVHAYVKELHRKLQVSSRGELLAKAYELMTFSPAEFEFSSRA